MLTILFSVIITAMCVYRDQDYAFIYKLKEVAKRFSVSVRACVLMINYYLYLLVALSDELGVSIVMQRLGHNYVHYTNLTFVRSGKLFGVKSLWVDNGY